jgi:hypothetical protein
LTVSPDSPWRDKLTVYVKGAPVKRDRWLLVIECPPGSASPSHPGTLLSEPTTQTAVPASTVTAYLGAGPSRTVKLGCFARTRSNSLNQSNTPEYASIGSVTLPALETDQAIAGAATTPTLYEDQQGPAGPVHLVQVFPGATCPSPAPTVTTSATAPAASPSAPADSSPSPQAGLAPPANPAAAPSPGIPGCFDQAPAGARFSAYYLPSSMQTKETLSNVNLTGYQIESIFPAPQITAGKGSPGRGAVEDYTWSGLSSLSPSLIVSNLAGQQTVSRYTFLAGVLLGIAGGAMVTFLERIWPRHIFRKRKRTKEKAPAAGKRTSKRPDDVTPSRPEDDRRESPADQRSGERVAGSADRQCEAELTPARVAPTERMARSE